MSVYIELLNLGIFLVIIALLCEYIDSALGGGYGTILVPVLLLFGFESDVLVPAVLFTEIWSGFASAFLHHFVGNAYFNAKIVTVNKSNTVNLSPDFKISIILAGCGVIGGSSAALIAINISRFIVNTYIGILVTVIGILVVLQFRWRFTWRRILGIGVLAAFNKGLSGGGYGPLVSSGQIIVNRNPKEAVAATSFSEAIVSIAALLIYIVAGGVSFIDPTLIFYLLIGAMASVPFAVLTVKYLPLEKLSLFVGFATILLGSFTLIKTWFL
ncbi:MAG: sulfite exporter TauE/SafE family protein [Promethearchaeota archaeon]